ncbi:hypothetical protein ANH9776_06375 [Aggregatibacter actinomycetemcomitans serotype e str. ANH9776]|nr:hypothetical protein ANH9776_06375 [Aggregatibacter actinomycetemcomitans serotype e str. ANH9776]
MIIVLHVDIQLMDQPCTIKSNPVKEYHKLKAQLTFQKELTKEQEKER